MKIHPQTIYKGHQPAFVVLPIQEYHELLEKIQDFQDVQEVKNHMAEGGETFPMEVVLALAEGQNPIKVYREYRGISQTALANKVKVSKQYISQLEAGERHGTTKIIRNIARVLNLDLEDIVT